MKRPIGWKIGLILAVLILSIWVATPLKDNIKLGLDLKGGMHLVLDVQVDDAVRLRTDRNVAQLKSLFKESAVSFDSIKRNGYDSIDITGTTAKDSDKINDIMAEHFSDLELTGSPPLLHASIPSHIKDKMRDNCIQNSIETIRNRVDKYGVAEAGVQEIGIRGESKILVSLPGVDDPNRIKDLINSTAMLEFKHVNAGPFETEEAARAHFKGHIPEDLMLLSANPGRMEAGFYVLSAASVITGDDLKDASRGKGRMGTWEIHFSLTSQGANKFRTYTAANLGQRLAIVFDNQIESVARIDDVLSYYSRITGNYSFAEVNDMVLKLQSGALPASMTPLQERVIGPSLGADSIRKGVTAAVTGLLLVMLFMVVYYRAAGVNAVLALIFNIILLIAAMAYLGFTLTLPGIAGIILTIGMAVDANVLIFERIKEELKNGKSPKASIDLGFKKAFVTILDANLTTVIAAFFLLQFGTGAIKGFAVTLIIGICASMFTAQFVSRVIFQLAFQLKKKTSPSTFLLHRNRKGLMGNRTIHFMNNRAKWIALSLSLLVILAGTVTFFTKGFNMGIDFSGGSMLEVSFNNAISEESLRDRLQVDGSGGVEIQRVGGSGHKFFIKTAGDFTGSIIDKVKGLSDSSNEVTILSRESVGPKVGADLTHKVILSTVWVLLGMLVYIGFRFQARYALAAVITLVHDVLFCLTILLLFNIEISLPVFAALLTIIGYSLNDTIVIFDRVRDNLKLPPDKGDGKSFKERFVSLLNRSITQTLSRTVVTSGTTLATVLALLLFGGEVLYTFAFTLLTGILVGTYSSIFQSCAWLTFWKRPK
jgi:SecD/SecF fusion protein